MSKKSPFTSNEVKTTVSKCDTVNIPDYAIVKVIEAGNIVRYCYSDRQSYGSGICKLSKSYYMDKYGEIHKYKNYKDKTDDKYYVRKALQHCCDLIDTNFNDKERVLFCTLTYEQGIDSDGEPIPMRDHDRLSKDMGNFMKKLKRHYPNMNRYICTVSPQFNGNWHIHMLLHFTNLYPFISNLDLSKLWEKGYCSIRRIYSDIHDVALYMTIRQKNLDITESTPDFDISSFQIIEVDMIDAYVGQVEHPGRLRLNSTVGETVH